MRRMLTGLGVLAIVAAIAAVTAGGAVARPGLNAQLGLNVKLVRLDPLNDSGVHGTAILIQRHDRLRVIVVARGLEPGQPHPQHIHGLAGDTNATCPSADAADDIAGDPPEAANPDDVISFAEGLPFFGPVLVDLQRRNGQYPTANRAGVVAYTRSFAVSGDAEDLDDESIVLHGLMLPGGYAATVPVACAEIG